MEWTLQIIINISCHIWKGKRGIWHPSEDGCQMVKNLLRIMKKYIGDFFHIFPVFNRSGREFPNHCVFNITLNSKRKGLTWKKKRNRIKLATTATEFFIFMSKIKVREKEDLMALVERVKPLPLIPFYSFVHFLPTCNKCKVLLKIGPIPTCIKV